MRKDNDKEVVTISTNNVKRTIPMLQAGGGEDVVNTECVDVNSEFVILVSNDDVNDNDDEAEEE